MIIIVIKLKKIQRRKLKVKKLLTAASILILLVSCSKPETVDVGMIVSLTGNYSPLLISARNGALLAAEEINRDNSKLRINLIIEDDESNIETVRQTARNMLGQDIDFFLLSITSAAYAAVEQDFTGSPVLSISTTITSDEFRRKDDNFIRMTPDISNYAVKLAGYTAEAGKKRVAIVYDANNITYAETMYGVFMNTLDAAVSGAEYKLFEYNTLESPSFRELGEKITAWSSETVLIITSAFDAALICQNLRTGEPLLLLAPWAVSDELIKNGGNAVENTVFFLKDTSGESSESYKNFVAVYKDRFSSDPSFQSVMNYDAVRFLYSIIRQQKSITPDAVKAGILNTGSYEGVDQVYTIDKYGDCSHPLIASTIKNGKIIDLQQNGR